MDDPCGFLSNPENVAILGGGSVDLFEISGKLGHGTYSGSADFCRSAGLSSITYLNTDQSWLVNKLKGDLKRSQN